MTRNNNLRKYRYLSAAIRGIQAGKQTHTEKEELRPESRRTRAEIPREGFFHSRDPRFIREMRRLRARRTLRGITRNSNYAEENTTTQSN